jgi:hypothetical protein
MRQTSFNRSEKTSFKTEKGQRCIMSLADNYGFCLSFGHFIKDYFLSLMLSIKDCDLSDLPKDPVWDYAAEV